MIVYTSMFGPSAKPLLEPLFRSPEVRMICFTDRTDLRPAHWEIVPMTLDLPSVRASRCCKLLPHLLVEDEWTLYHDSNFRLLVDPRPLTRHGEFVAFRHHFWDRISDEAEAIIRLRKDTSDTIRHQLATYQAEGFDTEQHPQQRLVATGVLLRRDTPEVRALNEAWWDEMCQHSHRDQMSLDYVAWRQQFQISYWPDTYDHSRYFQFNLAGRYGVPRRTSRPPHWYMRR